MKMSRKMLYVLYTDGDGEDIGFMSQHSEKDLDMYINMIDLIMNSPNNSTREEMDEILEDAGYTDEERDEWFYIIPLDCQSDYCGIREFKVLVVTDVFNYIRS